MNIQKNFKMSAENMNGLLRAVRFFMEKIYGREKKYMKKLLSIFVVITTCAALTTTGFAFTQEDNGGDVVKLQQAQIDQGFLTDEAEVSYESQTKAADEPRTYSSMAQKYESGEVTEEELVVWLQKNYLYKGVLLVRYAIEALMSENGMAEVDAENLPKDLKREKLINEGCKAYVSLETLKNLASTRLNTPAEDYKADTKMLAYAAEALTGEDTQKEALEILMHFNDEQTEDTEKNVEDEELISKASTLLMIADAAVTYRLTSEQIEMLSDAGIITGIKDYTIENGTDIEISDLIAINTAIVKNIQVDDSEVSYNSDGSYIVYCHIFFDTALLKTYEEQRNMNFTLPDEKLDFVTVSMVTIVFGELENVSEEKTAAVITKDNKNEVIAQTTAQVTEKATTVTEVKKNQEATENTEKAATDIERVNTTAESAQKTQTAQPQPQTQPETQFQPETHTEAPTTAHIHSYEVAENIPATCETDGYILYECMGCGDMYSETIDATGHSWVEISQGWIVNRVTKVVCRWCEEQFDTVDDWVIHSIDTGHGNYTWWDVEVSREPVSDDLAQTWSYIGDQCSICGAWR